MHPPQNLLLCFCCVFCRHTAYCSEPAAVPIHRILRRFRRKTEPRKSIRASICLRLRAMTSIWSPSKRSSLIPRSAPFSYIARPVRRAQRSKKHRTVAGSQLLWGCGYTCWRANGATWCARTATNISCTGRPSFVRPWTEREAPLWHAARCAHTAGLGTEHRPPFRPGVD